MNNNNHPMSSSSQSAVQVINVGTPHHPTGWSSAHIKFHNFSHLHLQHSRGQSLDSPIFRIHYVDWYLRVYPRGQDKFAVEVNIRTIFITQRLISTQENSIQLSDDTLKNCVQEHFWNLFLIEYSSNPFHIHTYWYHCADDTRKALLS
jgi:hypothetical protein